MAFLSDSYLFNKLIEREIVNIRHYILFSSLCKIESCRIFLMWVNSSLRILFIRYLCVGVKFFYFFLFHVGTNYNIDIIPLKFKSLASFRTKKFIDIKQKNAESKAFFIILKNYLSE